VRSLKIPHGLLQDSSRTIGASVTCAARRRRGSPKRSILDSREIFYPKPLFIGFLRQSGAGRSIAVTATAWFPAARTQRQ